MAIEIDPTQVVMYSSRFCGYCMRAKALLSGKTDKLRIINTDGNSTLRKTLASKTGSRTVPQIWVGERYVGGCDDLFALEQNGQLDPLLDAL